MPWRGRFMWPLAVAVLGLRYLRIKERLTATIDKGGCWHLMVAMDGSRDSGAFNGGGGGGV